MGYVHRHNLLTVILICTTVFPGKDHSDYYSLYQSQRRITLLTAVTGAAMSEDCTNNSWVINVSDRSPARQKHTNNVSGYERNDKYYSVTSAVTAALHVSQQCAANLKSIGSPCYHRYTTMIMEIVMIRTCKTCSSWQLLL
jgi:hypothetical protein